MPFTTKRKGLSLTSDEKQRLESLRRSRSGEKRETLHAGILLDLTSGMSDGAVARSNKVNRHTVSLCARKAFQSGLARTWESCQDQKELKVFRMTPLPGSIWLVKNRRTLLTRTSYGPIRRL